MSGETPAEVFTGHLNNLTRDLGGAGLYWRGDLAQFRISANRIAHICGEAIPLSHNEHRLDYVAMIATIHLQHCPYRQGQSATPQEPADPAPPSTA